MKPQDGVSDYVIQDIVLYDAKQKTKLFGIWKTLGPWANAICRGDHDESFNKPIPNCRGVFGSMDSLPYKIKGTGLKRREG